MEENVERCLKSGEGQGLPGVAVTIGRKAPEENNAGNLFVIHDKKSASLFTR